MHSLKVYRAANGLTQKQLADQFGVSRETLARWEIDARKIDPARLPQISKVTGIPAAKLLPSGQVYRGNEMTSFVMRGDVSCGAFTRSGWLRRTKYGDAYRQTGTLLSLHRIGRFSHDIFGQKKQQHILPRSLVGTNERQNAGLLVSSSLLTRYTQNYSRKWVNARVVEQ